MFPGLLMSGTGDHRVRMSARKCPYRSLRETESQREDTTVQGHWADERESQAEDMSLLDSGAGIILNGLKLP